MRWFRIIATFGLFGALAGIPELVAAQTAPQPACLSPAAPRIDIFYVNGVTTTLDEARVNAGKLEQEFLARLASLPQDLQAFCYVFQLNYNPTDGEVKDFLEAGQQRFGLSPATFWQGLEGVTVFSPLLTQLQGPMTDVNQIDQATIQRHASRYRQELLPPSCRRVLVVPHSQGNLYTNAAYDLTFGGPAPNPPVGALKIAGVATPDSQVKGNGKYRSSSTDLLINAIRLTLTNTLPANTNWGGNVLNIIPPAYSGGHSFIGYLSFDPSRTDIMNDIQTMLDELKAVQPCPS
ncbi:MAG: hypothetical protein NW703_07420 [Nitrospiraceae bacterium]